LGGLVAYIRTPRRTGITFFLELTLQSYKPRLAIDMDEVIADAHPFQAAWFRENFGYEWSPEQIETGAWHSLVTADHAEAMEAALHDGKMFGAFAPMAGSQDALRRLMERYDVFITTAAMEYPASCGPKFAWLQEHFPFIPRLNIVFCGDKSILAADLLVDDNVRHFARFQGQGVLFSAPHNANVEWPVRVSGWAEALAYLMRWQPA